MEKKIRFVAILDPEKGNGLRYGAVASRMLFDLNNELLGYQNQFNAAQGIALIDVSTEPEEGSTVHLRASWDKSRYALYRLTLMLVDGEPVGVLMNTRHPKSKYVSFWNFYVKPEFRGKGYGTQLMEYTMEQHRALGFKEMGLTVHTYNPRAEAFYRRYGFAANTKEMFVAL